jgi:hypothetical protein
MPHKKFTTPLAALLSVSSAEVFGAALARAGAEDPEVLKILLAKVLNPHIVLSEGEEAKLRGIKKSETLAGYKKEKWLPQIL